MSKNLRYVKEFELLQRSPPRNRFETWISNREDNYIIWIYTEDTHHCEGDGEVYTGSSFLENDGRVPKILEKCKERKSPIYVSKRFPHKGPKKTPAGTGLEDPLKVRRKRKKGLSKKELNRYIQDEGLPGIVLVWERKTRLYIQSLWTLDSQEPRRHIKDKEYCRRLGCSTKGQDEFKTVVNIR